jgi:hypothetical protein
MGRGGADFQHLIGKHFNPLWRARVGDIAATLSAAAGIKQTMY